MLLQLVEECLVASRFDESLCAPDYRACVSVKAVFWDGPEREDISLGSPRSENAQTRAINLQHDPLSP
jgi:hypothetical protein